MVVRTDSTGEEIWTIYLSNEEGLPEIYAGAIDGENNFVALGRDNSMLLKINADGEIFWNQVYDENGDVFSIARCFDEGYLLTGRSYNYDDRMYDMYAVKIDAAGEIEWENSYDGGFSETCSEAIQTGDSSYCLVGGSRFGVMDSLYAMIVRIDAEGNEIWNRVYNEYRRGDHLTDVVETADGGFAAAGFGDNGETDYLLMRTNSEGEPLWHTFFEGGEYDQCNSLLLMEDGGYLLGGFSGGAWIVRTEPDPANAVWEVDPSFPSVFQINPAYPNPFNSITNISYNLNCNNCVEIVVIDLKGNQVRTLVNGPLQAGYHTEIWDGRNEAGIPVSSGLYFYRISAGNFSKIRKMSLIK
jgi:outer membrane protein assembly factor BamB